MDERKHYICTGGCGAVSETIGTCGAETCSEKGQPFTQCDCSNGKHHKESKDEDKEEIL